MLWSMWNLWRNIIKKTEIRFSNDRKRDKSNPISKIAIFNAFIPILGVIFSAIILGEPMKLKYFVAGMLVALGVYVINKFDGK